MNSIAVAWNKQAAGEVKFLPNRQYSHPDPSLKKATTKRVHFAGSTAGGRSQAFESTAQPHSESIQSDDFIFTDHDYRSLSSTNASVLARAEPLCTLRGLIITLIIIVLIIIATAVALGVPLSTIKSSSTTGGMAAQLTAHVNASSTAAPSLLTSSVSIGSQTGAPCSSYTTIDDPTRNVAQVGAFGSCDNGPVFNSSNGGAWIRFVGSSGTILAQSSPGRHRCGGFISVWLNSTLPTVVGTTVNATLCFDSDPSICFVRHEIQATYCPGSFYIYFLEPVRACNARYCTTSAAPIG